jgi:DNA-binding transcriptional LysR family regulator
VSRAADALGMSQPAMSFALNKLRALFGDPLFIRASRGMQPTPRAQQLIEPLQSVLDRIRNDVLQRPSFDPATAQRVVTFNMSDIGELVFLPRILEHLRRTAPGIDVRTVSTPPAQLEEALQSGEVDLVVGYFPNLQGAAIYQQRLFSHSFVCLMRADHPVIGEQITRKQFLEAQHAVVHPEGKSHEVFERALQERGLRRRVVLSIPHYLALPVILGESDLIVTVPYAVGKSFARMANIKMLRPPIDVPRADVKQLWHVRFHHDPVTQWIRGVVAELFLEAPRRARRGNAERMRVPRAA